MDAARSQGALLDREAVRKARTGDREAFRTLVERYQGRAYRLALRVMRDEEQARDAVQEAFLKAFVRLDRFEGRSSFYTWLYRLVMNQCLDMRRRDRSDRQVGMSDSETLEWMVETRGALGAGEGRAHEEGPGEHLERIELRRAVARAIDQLPDGARETLVLREVEGLSYAEIAEILAIPKGTVMSRLHYARRRVQLVLEQTGAVESGAAPEPPAGDGEAGAAPAPAGGRR